MATQRVRYVGPHTGGIEVPFDEAKSSWVPVAHHGVAEVDEKVARRLLKSGAFNPVDDEPTPKAAPAAKKKDDG